ncbi:MAG: caspase family protein [Bacteroidota bacterium]
MRRQVFLAVFSAILSFTLQAQELGLKESKVFSSLGDYVRQAQFSPCRNFFAFTIGDNTLRVYNRDWEKIFEHQGNPKAVGGVFAFSPDEKYLAYGRYKGFNDIAIISLDDLKVVQVMSGHTDYVNHLEFSNEGDLLVSASSDGSAIVWKLEQEEFRISQVIGGFESSLSQSSFSPDDRFLVTGDSRGNVLILERTKEGYIEFQRFQYRRHGIESVVFNPKAYEFITGSSYGLRRYRLLEKQFVLTDSLAEKANISYPMQFSPDGFHLAAGNYQTAVIFRVEKDSIFPVETVYRHMEVVFGAGFSDDGQFFVTCSGDQSLIVWEIDQIQPSSKSILVSMLGTHLTLAQRRALKPATVNRILTGVPHVLVLPKDEFETTPEYHARRLQVADHALSLLQKEMEKQYGVRSRQGLVEIPLQGLLGYNADLQIYKVRFMETEAGVAIPIDQAKQLKSQWEKSHIRAVREQSEGFISYRYSNFELFNPADKKYYPVTPLENPFHTEEDQPSARSEIKFDQQAEADPVPGTGKTFALMFATNVYDYFSDLVNPVLDAQTIAMELGESYGVFSEVVLNPTLAETAAVLREYASMSYDPSDNLLVFFAGHGVYDEVFREGYVISRDSRTDDLGKTSYLSHSNLRTMINNIDCPHIFLVMDVCFGGTFDPHLAATHRGSPAVYADISTSEFVERKLKYKTRLYLTSGGKEYVPDGRPGFHSPFARRFIESLRTYGGEDGVLTTSEILQFVEKVNPQPRFGEFGDNEPGSDFILVVR